MNDSQFLSFLIDLEEYERYVQKCFSEGEVAPLWPQGDPVSNGLGVLVFSEEQKKIRKWNRLGMKAIRNFYKARLEEWADG